MIKYEEQHEKKPNRIVWIVVGATVAIVAALLVILFVVILPTGDDEADAVLSTPIGDFTYTRSFSNTYDQSTANSGYTFDKYPVWDEADGTYKSSIHETLKVFRFENLEE